MHTFSKEMHFCLILGKKKGKMQASDIPELVILLEQKAKPARKNIFSSPLSVLSVIHTNEFLSQIKLCKLVSVGNTFIMNATH